MDRGSETLHLPISSLRDLGEILGFSETQFENPKLIQHRYFKEG